MFTVEQRDALRERVLQFARTDKRVVAGAAVGSLALGGGDRFSDLDLTFAVADGAQVADVLEDWTRRLSTELDAVHLLDLHQRSTVYRVFLLPETLQFDLSLTPAADFRPAGPSFRLLFGETAPGQHSATVPRVPAEVFGWGVVYALHARSCIERGRLWQAEHYVGAVRDHALTLACLREGVVAVQARGYDALSAETLARFARTHVAALDPAALRSALSGCVTALIYEGEVARVPATQAITRRLRELTK